MTFTPDELVRRRPVWQALSRLFLDSEFNTSDLNETVNVLLASRYSVDEIEHMLFAEVYPVCRSNLLDPVGDWFPFSIEWLESEIMKQAVTPRRGHRWRKLSLRTARGNVWDNIRRELAARGGERPCG